MKKLISIALALVMILSLATVAFAANADLNGHTYIAYQIFKGNYSQGEGEKSQLSNIEWGDGVDDVKLLEALVNDETFQKNNTFNLSNTASDVAEVIGDADKFGYDSEMSRHFAYIVSQHIIEDKGRTIEKDGTLDAGYYLIVDNTPVSGNHDVANLSLLAVTGDGKINITSKVDLPTLEKKVKDTNDSFADSTTAWQDSADYDIGDNVPYQITVTLPSDIDSYSKYTVTVSDYMSTGLTFNNDAKIYILNAEVETEITSSFTVSDVENVENNDNYDKKVEFVCDDLKAINVEGLTITKDSKIVIRYSCQLNENAAIGFEGNPNEAYLVYSNNPNYGHKGETGQTPKDKVIVFTYQLDVNKIDVNKDPLEGAGFTLYKWDASAEGEGKWVAVSGEVKGEKMTTFTFKGLDDGKYKLSETTTPEGYNTIKDIEFEINAKHDETSDDPKLTEITINDESFTAEQNDESKYTGVIETDVVNKAGSQLPETGGIGTTIFYVLGAMMVVGAAVLLVTKKRMSAAE